MNQDTAPDSSATPSDAGTSDATAAREPYEKPVIEPFPPMTNVTFGTNVNPMGAMVLAG